MTIYNIHHTDKNKPTINVDETEIDTTSTDLNFFGRRRLQYGEDMNQNILFILENFACPENISLPGTPDFTLAINPTNSSGGTNFEPLQNPTDGQMWYNSTQQRLFYWEAVEEKWVPIGMQDDVAANWGVIYHGQQLPHPISQKTGYVFPYSECSWIVSPYNFPEQMDYMVVSSDATATVTSLYSPVGNPAILQAFATYLIVGIKGNVNLGVLTPVPSNTPTPAITPTASTTPMPTPAVTPTSTPGATPTYTGPLTAVIAARYPTNNGFTFEGPGTIEPYFQSQSRRIKYPGISTTKYKILYSGSAPAPLHTTPAAPFNPWEASAGAYYIFIKNVPESGGILPNFSLLDTSYHKIIFCSGKSTEPGTSMVSGNDGLFYKISTITDYGTVLQLRLVTVPIAEYDTALLGHPPVQNSPVDMLKFNYDYVYATTAYHSEPELPAQTQDIFYLGHPTPYMGSYDLYVYGGTPPYSIEDIYNLGVSPSIENVISSGFGAYGEQVLAEPVPISSLTSLDPGTKAYFTGTIALPSTNPNIELIPNGYVIRNYLTADFDFGSDYAAKYGGSCKPEWLWHWAYTSAYGSLYNENAGCAAQTGYATAQNYGTFGITVKDSTNAIALSSQNYGALFQTIDFDLMDTIFNFYPTYNAINANNTITAAGTYSSNINLFLGMYSTSVLPAYSPAQMQYAFSLLHSSPGNPNPSSPGTFTYESLATPLPNYPNLNCLSAAGTQALIHTGCDISNVDPNLQCSPYGGFFGNSYTNFQGGRALTPGTNYQRIKIIKVWNNSTNSIVDISGTPIYVKLDVENSPNTFNWTNLTMDRTNNHTGSFTTPRVPNNMRLDVEIPAGLNFPGTLSIPVFICGYDGRAVGCSIGTSIGGGIYRFNLNFNNTV